MQEIRYRLDRKSAIATLEIDTAGPVNTVGGQFISDLADATRRANQDGAKGVLLRSAKERSFLDGADLVEIRKDPSPVKLEMLLRGFHQALDALAASPFPVAAAVVNQTALGGGFELLLWACDKIFATPGAIMGLPEVNVGLFPAAGGLQTLQRLVGFETALEIIMGGKVLPAEAFAVSEVVQIVEAQHILAAATRWLEEHPQIVNRNLDADQKPAEAPDTCRKLIEKARKVYTVCPQRPYFAAALAAAEEALGLSFRASVERQVNHFAPLIADDNVKNKIDSFFTITSVAPKLAAVDADRALPVERVAVIGAGLMGRGIAQVCADNGLPVLLFDVDLPAAESAKKRIAEGIKPLVDRGRWPAARAQRLLENIEPSDDNERIAETALVIESAFENLELKRRILQKVESVNRQAVFATNTSALPIAELSAEAARPQQVVGMHYFSPVALMPLLEAVRGPQTSPAALATAVTCGRRQRKTVIVVGDGPGFYTSRTFGVYVLTGFYLAEMGIDPWEVDRLALRAGFPQGPLHVYGPPAGP
jgi:3-hydroxyacyl-CoA dehydrogenase/enoyl-CoA hydratase/3-hydroxybutyryl-CoA epimerase